ncbi:POK9 protein, partial [Ploceus nigricollis]|nr:POK9 protein [Ploceus nigricollis]
SGSLSLDLATTIDVTLIDMKPVKIPTGIKGPVMHKEKPCGALLLGRSSAGLKGLFVLPGVIDADFTGEILIVAMTLYPPLTIPAGSKIAQLVPTLQLTEAASSIMHRQRGPDGFRSTGSMALLCLPMEGRPKAPVLSENGQQRLQLSALLDTGADITIIS